MDNSVMECELASGAEMKHVIWNKALDWMCLCIEQYIVYIM